MNKFQVIFERFDFKGEGKRTKHMPVNLKETKVNSIPNYLWTQMQLNLLVSFGSARYLHKKVKYKNFNRFQLRDYRSK